MQVACKMAPQNFLGLLLAVPCQFFASNNPNREVEITVCSYSKKEAMYSSLSPIAISLEKNIVGLNFLFFNLNSRLQIIQRSNLVTSLD